MREDGRTCVALRIEEGRETDSARLMVVVYLGMHRCAYRPAGFDGFGGGGKSTTGCVRNAAVWFLMESSELHDWSRSEREEEGGVGFGSYVVGIRVEDETSGGRRCVDSKAGKAEKRIARV
ncbi:hypothetical protein, conserved [Eimeria brunetti]|uniref:Uncharacterized protein n=1 Tax=Eimeria brunetti TaxID=51314 RepID=U6LP31_9EIME|nr:hypothetical protein, conserved [Eimeria brunetti]